MQLIWFLSDNDYPSLRSHHQVGARIFDRVRPPCVRLHAKVSLHANGDGGPFYSPRLVLQDDLGWRVEIR